jgi:hypothetical protein
MQEKNVDGKQNFQELEAEVAADTARQMVRGEHRDDLASIVVLLIFYLVMQHMVT